VIAYSLNSEDYRNSLAQYLAAEDLPQYNGTSQRDPQLHTEANGGKPAEVPVLPGVDIAEPVLDSAADAMFGANDTLVSDF
jgi:hypothetical protein